MFRNHRNLFTAATILALFLLSSLPAAAGSRQARSGEGAWEMLVSQALSWLGAQGSGFSAIWGEYSSMIDPLGQPVPTTSSYIDPNGSTSTGASTNYSSQIDPNG